MMHRCVFLVSPGHLRTQFRFSGDFDLWSRFFLYANLYGTYSPLGGFRYRFNQRVRMEDFYAKESEIILNDARNICKWSQNSFRDKVIQLKMHKVPKLKKILTDIYGFDGKKVVRENQEKPTSYWKIEEYKFL